MAPELWQAVLGAHPTGIQVWLAASQTAPAAQLPQSRACPQPSPTEAQYFPPAKVQLIGVQPGLPQRFDTPVPPHVSGAAQLEPQSIERPQPSPIVPQ